MNDTVSVIAGGWSLKGVDMSRVPGHVIAVNDAAVHSPRVHEIVTMDRLWAENRWPKLGALGLPTYMRRACLLNLPERPKWLHLYECDWQSNAMSADDGTMNGTNSGMVALNRAYQLAPKRVLLFGFDCNLSPKGEPYFFPRYPWVPQGTLTSSPSKFRVWAKEYEAVSEAFAARGIEALNCSPISAITAFRKVSLKDVLE